MRSIIARSLCIEAQRATRGTMKRCDVDRWLEEKKYFSPRCRIAAHAGAVMDPKNKTLILAFVYKVYFKVLFLRVAAKLPRAIRRKKFFASSFTKNDFSS
ncbi:MAG: hypothetical protein ABFD69_07035 [Candidatus Sumerlaeia bacterium]